MKPEGKFISISRDIEELPIEEIFQADFPEHISPRIEEEIENLSFSMDAAAEAISIFAELLSDFVDTCCVFIQAYTDAMATKNIIDKAPNSRVKHLALHAKKRRVRNKNIARLVRESADFENEQTQGERK